MFYGLLYSSVKNQLLFPIYIILCFQLKIRNDREEESLTRIFDQRQNIEEKIEKMEAEIQHEKAMTENRVQDMVTE